MGRILPEGKGLRAALLSLTLLCFLIGIVLFIFLRTDILSRYVQDAVLPKLEASVGKKVILRESRLHFFPTYWSAEAVSVPEGPGGANLFEAAQIKVYLRLFPLLGKRLQIDRVLLAQPRISLVRYADGRFNFSGLFPSRPGGWDVRAGETVIRNGDLVFHDLQNDRHIRIHTVDGTVGPEIIRQTWEMNLKGVGEVRMADREQKEIRIQSRLSVNREGVIDVQSLQVSTSSGSVIKTTGTVRMKKTRAEKNRAGGAPPDERIRLDLDWDSRLILSDWKAWFPGVPGKGSGPQGVVQFTGKLHGPLPDLSGEGSFALRDVRWQGLSVETLSGKMTYAAGDLRLKDVRGNLLDGVIAGEGRFQTQGEKVYTVRLEGNGLQLAPFLTHYLPPSVQLDGRTVWDGEVQLSGKGISGDSVAGDIRFRGHLPEGEVTAFVHLAEGKQVKALFSGEMKNVLRLVQLPKLPIQGGLSFQGEMTGTLEAPVIRGSARLTQAVIRQSPLDDVQAEFEYAGKSLEVNRLEMVHQEARYQARGRILFSPPYSTKNPFFEAEARVTRGDPQEFVTFFYKKLPLHMSATGTLRFQGDLHDFEGQGDLEVSEGSAYGQTFDRGHVTVQLEKDRIVFQRVRTEKNESVLEGEGWIGFREKRGRFEAHLNGQGVALADINVMQKSLPVFSGRGTFRIDGEGSFREPKIMAEGQIDPLLIREKEIGLVRLSLTENREGLQGTFSFMNGKSSAAGRIDWAEAFPFHLAVKLDQAPIEPLLTALRPEGMKDLSLSLTGDLTIDGRLSALSGTQMILDVQDLQASYKDYPFQADGPFQATYREGDLRFDAIRLKGEGTVLTLVGGMAPFKRYSLFVTGEADLRLLTLLTHEMDFSKGRAYLALMVNGPWENPAVQGGLTIREGTFRSARLKQGVDDAEMTFFFNGKQIVLEAFRGNIGDGTLKATGKIEMARYLPSLAVDRFGLALEVAHAVFRYPEGMTARLSGTFFFQGTPQNKQLKGDVRIEEAAYEKRVELRSMVLELRQAREKIEEKNGTPFLGDTQLDVHFLGTEKIWVNNNLAKFPLQVDLVLRGTLNRPQLFGNVAAQDGTFVFRRNDFKVLSATADFISTDTIRPVLDIHAQTEIRGYKIDLRLTGTVERFNLSLQSDPVLSETDILALLTVGQTAAEISEAKTEIGTTEATIFLAGPLQEKLEEEVQKITGVDRFQVEPYYTGSKSSGGARLTIGKRLLEDRLYVTYTTALALEEDLIKLEYLLGKNVFLAGERDENGRLGGDLKFRFEFR